MYPAALGATASFTELLAAKAASSAWISFLSFSNSSNCSWSAASSAESWFTILLFSLREDAKEFLFPTTAVLEFSTSVLVFSSEFFSSSICFFVLSIFANSSSSASANCYIV